MDIRFLFIWINLKFNFSSDISIAGPIIYLGFILFILPESLIKPKPKNYTFLNCLSLGSQDFLHGSLALVYVATKQVLLLQIGPFQSKNFNWANK